MDPLQTYWLVVLSVAGTMILFFACVLLMALFIDMIGTVMERRIEKHKKKREAKYAKYADSSDLYGKP